MLVLCYAPLIKLLIYGFWKAKLILQHDDYAKKMETLFSV